MQPVVEWLEICLNFQN